MDICLAKPIFVFVCLFFLYIYLFSQMRGEAHQWRGHQHKKRQTSQITKECFVSSVFSRALLPAGNDSTCHSAMLVVQPVVWWSVCPWQYPYPCPTPPLQKRDFWAAQVILSNFCFWNFFFFVSKYFFFHPKFFFTSKDFLTFTFLDVLCHPECSKNFHPKFVWVKQGTTQCLPSISRFSSAEHLQIS